MKLMTKSRFQNHALSSPSEEGRMNARVGEPRGERKRSERVERCTTTKYDDAAVGTRLTPSKNDRRYNGPMNTTIYIYISTVSSFLMRQEDISYSELTLTAQLETAFFHNAKRVYTFKSSKELRAIPISKKFYNCLFRFDESTIGTPIKCTEMMTFRFHVVIVSKFKLHSFFHPTESNLLGNLCACGTRMSSLFNIGKQQGYNDPLCYTMSLILYNLKKYIPDRINTGNAKIKLKEQYAIIGIAGTMICLSKYYVLSCSYEISCMYLPNEQLFLVIHPPGHYGGSCKMENQDQNIDQSDRGWKREGCTMTREGAPGR
ncbi:hypothetical protein ALC53_11609 [Atta colombica]|uniref:Uncharacterized protein n=1 Tax=Atta colombica TaxID=520822 RepID=A0A195B0D6_9HYME|nr:hypothetical protein ALC53_11609 [Atta colombica]